MEIFLFFFKFGWVAFGGPAAHISLMEEELVKKRKWLSSQESFIIAAIYKLGKKAVKSGPLMIAGILAVVAAHFDINEIFIILGVGFLGIILSLGKRRDLIGVHAWMLMLVMAPSFAKAEKIFLIFLKIGSVLFGSGYVLFAYLDGELIDKLGWLNYDQLVEAVAVGQMTPGPVLSTATFIGYELAGVPGALSATLGIFLPAFLFVWLLNPIVHRMRSSVILTSFLDYVNVAAVAVMLYVTYEMALSVLSAPWLIALSVASLIAYFRISNLSPFVIIIVGGVIGYIASVAQL